MISQGVDYGGIIKDKHFGLFKGLVYDHVKIELLIWQQLAELTLEFPNCDEVTSESFDCQITFFISWSSIYSLHNLVIIVVQNTCLIICYCLDQF